MSPAPPVVVVGGGLAGISVALSLADAGTPVVLLERRPFLGGRAFSFRDPDAGAVLDNGQHVLVGACTRLRVLLERIGAPPGAFTRQRRLSIPIADGAGRIARLSAPPLPAPLHAAAALARYRHLSPGARAATARDARALAGLNGPALAALESTSLGDWLAGRGAPEPALERFWEPLVRPALNVPAAGAHLGLSAFLIRRGVLAGSTAGALWLPATGLSAAIGEPALVALERSGVDVRLGERVTGIDIELGRAAGVRLAGGAAVEGRVVLALPPEATDRVLPSELLPPGGHGSIGASPIVNVYLWYDRPVCPLPFLGLFGSPLQWVFDRTRLLGREAAGGECLGVSLSAADDWIERPREEIADACDEAVGRVFAGRRGARRLRAAVVKEPRATFRAAPGVTARRPGPTGPAADLALAGDWTDTGWPATMEGAVRSGEAAAAVLLARP